MHLLTRLLMPESPAPKPSSRPQSPSVTSLAPTRRGSPMVRSRRSPTPTGKEKKENKKEKEGGSLMPFTDGLFREDRQTYRL